MLPLIDIQCPYCGESIAVTIDDSVGDQQYIEDCQVCCQPIVMRVVIDRDGAPHVTASTGNDA